MAPSLFAQALHEHSLCVGRGTFRSRTPYRTLEQSLWRRRFSRQGERLHAGDRRERILVEAATDGNGVFGTKLPDDVRHVYLDFDDTIAEGLSANLQVKAVIERTAKRMESAEQAQNFVKERKELIAKLSVEYEQATKDSLRSLLMKFPKGEFSEPAVNEAMDIWAEFDREWAQVSTDNNVFAGVRQDDFLSVAPSTPLKENALEAIGALQASDIDVSVVSINWSADWIQKVLGDKSSVARKDGRLVQVPEGHIKIYSNEMLFDEKGVSTGKLFSVMESGRDKAQVVREMMQDEGKSDSQGVFVFVGDSINDIQSLLLADVGIVMGQNPVLLAFAEHFGIGLKPLNELDSFSQDSLGAPVLFTTNSWMEVTETLLGKERAAQVLSSVAV